jgi:hypothetical protein
VPALQGDSLGQLAGIPPVPLPGAGTGVLGDSGSGTGVQGSSDTGIGVQGTSNGADAVQGTSSSSQHAGVSGINSGGGFAFWGASDSKNGTGIFVRGARQAAQFLQTDSTSDLDAVLATTSSAGHAAVAAHNEGTGAGLWATSASGYAIEAIGANNSGVYAEGHSAGAAAIGGRNTAGGTGVSGVSDTVGGIGIYARGATHAAFFQGNVEHKGNHHCTGTVTVDTDIQMQGVDFAEDFTIDGCAAVEPGTVVVIDEVLSLRPCEKPYDRRVAGVISGAGDYRPGLILDRQKDLENRLPVALVGKVYCKVDATYTPIEVGDLLTTSPTSGHAMKASDPAQAFGAVLGKALQSMTSGQGMIPILVALQ